MADVETTTMEDFTTDMPLQGGNGGASKLGWWDLTVIIIYFGFVLGVGIWSSRRSKSSTVSGYFLASRNMHWIPVGASLFASNIGSGHFIGLAGSGAAAGIGVAGFELSAVYILMLLGWVFVPVYMSSGIYTMPEYLKERFGGHRIRIYLSFLALLLYIFTKISADLYAGALFIQLALNKSSPEWLYLSILMLLAIAAVFTIAGGLTAVIWTDFVQTILMIVGAFILMATSFIKVGGFNNLVDRYPYATASIRATDLNNNTCGEPPKDYMHLLRAIEPGASDLPWTGMVFGLTINSIWYWCTDQVIVQRTLSSKNMTHAKAGCVLAAFLKFLPLWLLVFPGMAARILFPDRVGCADPDECVKICGSPKGCSNIAYAELVFELLPPGMAGLMLAVMMAALMSSLTSIFNSASTIFTIDVWSKFRKRASDAEQLMVGRCFVILLVIVSVIWIPVIQNSGTSQLFDYIQSISSFLAPPICAVYLCAIFWDRTNEEGAFWGLMIGLIIGLIRFGVEFSFILPACGSGIPDPRPDIVRVLVGNVHYLHFSCILWLITLGVTMGVSLLTPPIPKEYLYRLTWSSRKDTRVRKIISDISNPKKESNINNFTISDPPPTERRSSWQRVLMRLCGVGDASDAPTPAVETQDNAVQSAKDAVAFLKEDPQWKSIVAASAVLCMTLSTFIFGFFA